MSNLSLIAQDYPPPGPGEVSGAYIGNLNTERARIGGIIAQVPPGAEGQGSPWFAKVQNVKTKLDQVSSSKTQVDYLAAIPAMAELFTAWQSRDIELPEFASKTCSALANLNVGLMHTVATHVEQQGGTVSAPVLTNLITMFRVGDGFVSEPNWELEPMPIDDAGVMILDAAAVVNRLKAGPWRQAATFLTDAPDAAAYFARYGSTGNGLAALKTKYAQNQAAIDGKFVELKTWIAQQKAQAGEP